MVSVCMATKNGAKYIREQLDSILAQLDPSDEIVISDDASTDETISLIESYNDNRIRLLKNKSSVGISRNFEISLTVSKGEFIFLADQDDVWTSNKVEVMKKSLDRYDLVVSDCLLVDHSLQSKNQ